MRYLFGPDINAPLVPLLSDTSWRQHVDRFLIYGQVVLADAPNVFTPSVGENCYPTLRDANFFAALEIPLVYECGVVKDWSPDAIEATDGILTMAQRTIDAGGVMPIISMDEPWTCARRDCHPLVSPESCTSAVLNACATLELAGIKEIELCEAYPYNHAHDILSWTDQLRAAGVPLVGLRLDVDHRSFGNPKSARLDLRSVRNQCESWDLPLSVILTPANPIDAASFCASALDWLELIPHYFEGWPDEIAIQSWQGANLPPTLPTDGPNTLAWLKDQAVPHAEIA